MKTKLQSKMIPGLVLGMGALCLALRWQLYAIAVDEGNLLRRGHPLEILMWLVCAAAAAVILAAVWKRSGSNRYEDNFAPSAAGAAGSFVLAAAVLLTVISGGAAQNTPEKARNILGILAAAALVYVGVCRLRGRKPFFAFHGVVCLFFATHMISRYQPWSSNPQLQDAVFSLLGCIALTLFAFYQTAFDADAGKRRMQLATGLAAVYVCVAALSRGEYPLLYLGGAVWAFTNLCRLTPASRRDAQEETQPAPQE